MLRLATVGSATWLTVTFGFVASGVIHENQTAFIWMLAPLLATMGLGAVSNALDVQFIPTRLRAWWQTGIRDRLWKSRIGEWVARRLGAPDRSRLAGASAFRATEAALGVAASELFAALPKEFREQIAELPAIVAALESIRLDLLRLHADAGELAPLTTLMDAARLIGEDLSRLAEAQREAEDAAGVN